MNRFKYILYTVIFGLLGSGLTAQAMKQPATRFLPAVVRNNNVVGLAKAGKKFYQQGARRTLRGGSTRALFTGVHNKTFILNLNEDKSYESYEKPETQTTANETQLVLPTSGDPKPAEAKTLIERLVKGTLEDKTEEDKESGIVPATIVPATKTEQVSTDLDLSRIVKSVFSPKAQQETKETKQIVSAGATEAQSQGVLKIDATKAKQPKKETKETKEKKLEEKKKKNAEKAAKRRQEDDKKLEAEKAKVAARKAKIDASLKNKFDKQLQLRRDQEARAQKKLEQEAALAKTDMLPDNYNGQDLAPAPLRDTMLEQSVEPRGLSTLPMPQNINARYPLSLAGKANMVGIKQTFMVQPTPAKTTKPANMPNIKLKQPKIITEPVDTKLDTLVPVRNQNNDSATQLVHVKDPMSLVEIEKLLTDEVVVNITTDNPVARLKQLDAIYGDTINSQLAVRNAAKNQILRLEKTGRGDIKQAVLFVPTQQLKDILGKFGVRFNGKRPAQFIISPAQTKKVFNGITGPKRPALPEATGKNRVPRNNSKIIDIPVDISAEKPRGLLTTPVSRNNAIVPRLPMVSAGRAKPGVYGPTLSASPKSVSTAIVPRTRPTQVGMPKRIKPKRKSLVVAEKARVKVDNTGLKSEATKIEIPEQERFEREEEVARERERFERDREERERLERDKEREEEQKEIDRLEERERREEELRRDRDREREEEQKEIDKRNKRNRRGPKQRADLVKDVEEDFLRAERAENTNFEDISRRIITAGAADVALITPVTVPAQPVPTASGLESPYIPRQDPCIADYRKIIAMARKPIAEITQNNLQMKMKWAHGDSGIERMLYAFNNSADMIMRCNNDAQLANDDPNRQYSTEAISTAITCFESTKKQIVDDMVQALAELDSAEEDAGGLLSFHVPLGISSLINE